MLTATTPQRKSRRVTKSALVSEIEHLRILLESAIAITLDATEFLGDDTPEDRDEMVAVPFGLLESLRDAAQGYARSIGYIHE